jgi:hypothetical protein
MISKWRIAILVFLVVLPILFLVVAGSVLLWQQTWGVWVWWGLALAMAAAYFLAWHWQRKRKLLPTPEHAPPMHWTPRDHEAWRLVEARTKTVGAVASDKLLSIQHYFDTGQEMAYELAAFYHPNAKDPVGGLTVSEILALAELAAADLAEMVETYVPGGSFVTIDQWKKAGRAVGWYNRAMDTYWVASAILSPIQTAARYAASKLGLGHLRKMLQDNVLAWFFAAFVSRIGWYLIELNSGRLRVGAKRYRELQAQAQQPGINPLDFGDARAGSVSDGTDSDATPNRVSVTIIGQVKAGKSSLVNALLGEQKAAFSVLPMTNEITAYEVDETDIGAQLTILDTVGYAHEGPRRDQLRATAEAVQKSDVVLLVLHARDPARKPDVDLLRQLAEYYAERPHLKPPPMLAVLTHVDLLSPALEWQPPYDWHDGNRPKEQSIRAAAEAAHDDVGEHVTAIVPVCLVPGKIWGIDEELLPRMLEKLGEARAVAFVRLLHREAKSDGVGKALSQLWRSGKELLRAAVKGPPSTEPRT